MSIFRKLRKAEKKKLEADKASLLEEAKYRYHTPGMLGESLKEKLQERIKTGSQITREVCLDLLMEIMEANPSQYNLAKKRAW